MSRRQNNKNKLNVEMKLMVKVMRKSLEGLCGETRGKLRFVAIYDVTIAVFVYTKRGIFFLSLESKYIFLYAGIYFFETSGYK